jgi:hypothetical protein
MTPGLPPSLDAFLAERVPLFYDHDLPDGGWFYDVAQIYATSPDVVEQLFRARWESPPPRARLSLPPSDPTLSRPRGFEAVVAAFRRHGHELKPNARGGWRTRCPLHRDRRPSLEINRGDDGRANVFCHSCRRPKSKAIIAAVGLTWADCFVDGGVHRQPVRVVLAEYPYTAMAGTYVATKVRYRDGASGKRFGWRVGQRWSLTVAEKATVPLYREQDLIECTTVYVVEGELAADRLWSDGLAATCGAHGAGKWEPRWTENLRLLGAEHVVILTDHDAAGRAHGELVASALHDAQIAVRVVALPGLARGEDVVDWLARGGTAEGLAAIAAVTPVWSPGLAEQQRVERQRAKWKTKKANQRLRRRERERA